MAPPDQQPTNEAQLVMVERGVNISKHRSRALTNRMIGEADLILVMERAHQSYIEKYVPSSRGKVFLLKAFGEKPEIGDIEDPIGRDLEFYRHSAEILELEINRILPALLEWSGKI